MPHYKWSDVKAEKHGGPPARPVVVGLCQPDPFEDGRLVYWMIRVPSIKSATQAHALLDGS